MASESIRFDFLTSGAEKMARDLKNTGDNAAAAARGAKALQDTIKTLGEKENRTAAESANLAKALRLTGDEEDRAAAKALAAEIAIKKLGEAEQNAARKANDAKSGFAGLVGEVTGFGAAAGAADSKGSLFTRVLAGLNLATGVLEPTLAGVVVAVGGLAAGFASAGAGLGVFGVVAQSNLTAASKAAGQVQTAQIAYNAAVANGTKKSVAYKAEQIAIAKAYAQLSPAQIALSKAVGNVQNQWQSFVQSNTKGVAQVLTKGFGLLPKVFAAMQPFLAPTEKALSGIIGQLGRGLGSSGFKSFIDAFAANSGPALTKIATAIGNIIVGIGGILKAFLPTSQSLLSGLDKITAKFREWGTTLSGHSGFQSLMQTFRTQTPQAVQVLKNLGIVLANVVKAMFGLSTFSNSKTLLQLLLPLSGILASLSKNTALDRVVLYLVAIGGAAQKVVPAFQGVKAGIEGIGVALKFASANPILIIAAAIIALGAAFYAAWEKSSGFRDFIKSVGHYVLDAGILVVKGWKIIIDAFLSAAGTILHAAADAFGWIPGLGGKLKGASKAFDEFKGHADNVLNGLIKTQQGWQRELGKSKAATDAATNAIVKDLTKAGFSATGAKQDVQNYTTAIQKNGAQSQQARGARQILIADLERAGVNAKTANRLVDNLQRSISGMHGKNVNVGVHGTGSGGAKITVSSVGGGAFAGKLVAISNRAAGGIITGGTAGRDSVPAMLMPGEVVVPTRMVKSGAVDHLRGRLPGFAAGGLVSPSPDVWGGRVENSYGADGKSAIGSVASAAYKTVVGSVVNALRAQAQAQAAAQAGLGNLPLGTGPHSGSAAVAQAFARSILWAYGWGPSQFPPLQALWNQESGWNSYAVNPSSGAYGIPQALGHGHPYNLGDYQAQIRWGLAYIKSRYGTPAAAEGHELAYHWYDQGGWLKPGVTLAVNNTGRPEQVIPPGGRAGGGNVTVVLENRGVIGSQQELEGWLSRSINNLARTGRLAYALRRSPSAG